MSPSSELTRQHAVNVVLSQHFYLKSITYSATVLLISSHPEIPQVHGVALLPSGRVPFRNLSEKEGKGNADPSKESSGKIRFI